MQVATCVVPAESKEAMLDFLGVDSSAAIRSLEWKGVYSSHDLYFGEDLHIKVIFLDLRCVDLTWEDMFFTI